MLDSIIWVHEKALSKALVDLAQEGQPAVFIWDDGYFKQRGYSLKRLVFIYETLCELPVEILHGDTFEVMMKLQPAKIQTLKSADGMIKALITQLGTSFDIQLLETSPFVQLPEGFESKRFFKYWNRAKKTAFLENGGVSS